ncbi:PH-like domain-containing protein [Parafrankia colletiae]|uniref:PH-like domain-containing protein n=1 Tax=Parafrankia colletiae TaxID=573497 RepID=UPI001F520233|nr:hypothetical protein [Parafrankia colletiae]
MPRSVRLPAVSSGAPAAPLALAGPVVLAAGRPSGPVLNLLLAVGLLLMAVAVIGAMRRAWRDRDQQQEDDLPDLPEPPEETGNVLAAPLRGRYLGTVDAGRWREWITARGLAGKDGDYIAVYEMGVRVDRDGQPFWIPREAVRGARLERGHAGKVAAPSRLIVVAWSFEGRELEAGFRGEDRARQPKVVRSVHDLIGPMPTAPMSGDITSPHAVPRPRARLRPRVPAPPRPAAPAGRPADGGAVPSGGPATMPIPVNGRQPRWRRGDPRPAGIPVGGPHGGAPAGPTARSDESGLPVPAAASTHELEQTTGIRRTGSFVVSPRGGEARDTGAHEVDHRSTGAHAPAPFVTGAYPTGGHSTGGHSTGGHPAAGHPTGGYETGALEAGSHGTGSHGTGAYTTGAYTTGAYSTGSSSTNGYETGSRRTGGYDTGGYDTGSHTTGAYSAGTRATGAGTGATGGYDIGVGTGAHLAGAYETGAHPTGGYPTGAYDTGAYSTGAHDTVGRGATVHGGGPSGTGAYDVAAFPEREAYPGTAEAGYQGDQAASGAHHPWPVVPVAGRSRDEDVHRFALPPGERGPGWEGRR